MNTPPKPLGTRTMPAASDTLADQVRDAADAVTTTVSDAIDSGQAALAHAGAAANEMADVATQQIKTFASELETMARRNPLGTIAGAVVVGVLIGLIAGGRKA